MLCDYCHLFCRVEDIDRILDANDSVQTKEETLQRLCARREEEIRLASISKRSSVDYGEERAMHGLQRSSTDYFGQVSNESRANDKSLSVKAKRIFSSPRLRRKTQSQVLRAASSIPSRKRIKYHSLIVMQTHRKRNSISRKPLFNNNYCHIFYQHFQ